MMPRLLAATALVSLLGAASAPALAEQADRNKPTLIEFDKSVIDELNQVAIYTGNVRLTRGTLVLTGVRMEVRVSPDGYRTALIVGTPERLATYRQRLDPRQPGIEEYVEGHSERIEYDDRTETIRFISQALLKRLEDGQPRDEVSGQRIVYDAVNRTTTIDGRSGPGDGRGRVILAPPGRTDAADPKPAPVPLQRERGLRN
jgi:lipopolysaccharide export system protein LptA